jgi:hypothetical protein
MPLSGARYAHATCSTLINHSTGAAFFLFDFDPPTLRHAHARALSLAWCHILKTNGTGSGSGAYHKPYFIVWYNHSYMALVLPPVLLYLALFAGPGSAAQHKFRSGGNNNDSTDPGGTYASISTNATEARPLLAVNQAADEPGSEWNDLRPDADPFPGRGWGRCISLLGLHMALSAPLSSDWPLKGLGRCCPTPCQPYIVAVPKSHLLLIRYATLGRCGRALPSISLRSTIGTTRQ